MKLMTAAVLSAALAASSLSHATYDRENLREYLQNLQEKFQNIPDGYTKEEWIERCRDDKPVPELDAGAAGLGLGLVLGLGALVRERRNRK